MLPQNRRIPRKMFPLLSEAAKVFKNNVFLLRLVQGNSKESQFCFSVSKKVAKSAVVRNRLRRTGYRLLQKYLLEIKSNTLALFSFRKVPKDDEETAQNINSILKESKLVK
jgi:ribonuclease P protein component